MSHKALLDLIEQASREETEELDLSYKGISTLPPEIGSLTNLQRLDLHNNQLTTLPETIFLTIH